MIRQAHVQRLREAISMTGLTVEEVWVGYYALGGLVSRFEIEAYIGGLLELPTDECDLVTDATNELLARATGDGGFRVPRCSDGRMDSPQESSKESRRALGSAGSFLLTGEEQELERLHAVSRTELLDTGQEERFDRITREAKEYFRCSSVIIALIDDRRQFLKSFTGPIQQNLPREITFCNATIRNAGPLIVRDALEDDRFRHNPLVIGQPYIRFYAGYPLRGPGGWTIGTLCIIDQQPRDYSHRDGRKLRTLARAVEDEINGGRLPPS